MSLSVCQWRIRTELERLIASLFFGDFKERAKCASGLSILSTRISWIPVAVLFLGMCVVSYDMNLTKLVNQPPRLGSHNGKEGLKLIIYTS